MLLAVGACGARSGLSEGERAPRDGAPDVGALMDAASPRDVAVDAGVDVGVDPGEGLCAWRILREGPVDPDVARYAIFVAGSGAESWLGFVAEGPPSVRRIELLSLGVDGTPLAPPVPIHTFPACCGYFSAPQIALDGARRAVIHAQGFADCQFVRFDATGAPSTPVLLGRGACTDLQTTPSGFALWHSPMDSARLEHVTLDDAGTVLRRAPFMFPPEVRRLATAELADGAVLIISAERAAEGSDTLRSQRYDADGAPEGPASILASTPETEVWAASLASTPTGYVLTWVEATDAFGSGPVILAHLDDRGTLVGTPEQVGLATRRARGPSSTLTVSHGFVLVSWHAIDDAGARIVVQPIPLELGAVRPPLLVLGARLDPSASSGPMQLVTTSIGALLTAAVTTDVATSNTTIAALTCD